MGMAALKTPAITAPITISALAEMLGVNRQRIYDMIRLKRIDAVPMSGGFVIMPDEANRVLNSAFKVHSTRGEERILFDFSKI